MTTGNCNAEIPSRPGIYQIRCVSNGKIYVGSAVNLRTRWQGHRRDLGNRVHVNRHMQQAWNRYGGKDFAFTILEFAEVPDPLERERAWIEGTRCTDRTLGFNVNCFQPKARAREYSYDSAREGSYRLVPWLDSREQPAQEYAVRAQRFRRSRRHSRTD